MDSRGHGRSTTSSANLTFDLMASDAIRLLNHLKINETHIVGWSDGGIIGLTIAMKHPKRLKSLFAFGASYIPAGVKNITESTVFQTFLRRAKTEYESMIQFMGSSSYVE